MALCTVAHIHFYVCTRRPSEHRILSPARGSRNLIERSAQQRLTALSARISALPDPDRFCSYHSYHSSGAFRGAGVVAGPAADSFLAAMGASIHSLKEALSFLPWHSTTAQQTALRTTRRNGEVSPLFSVNRFCRRVYPPLCRLCSPSRPRRSLLARRPCLPFCTAPHSAGPDPSSPSPHLGHDEAEGQILYPDSVQAK